MKVILPCYYTDNKLSRLPHSIPYRLQSDEVVYSLFQILYSLSDGISPVIHLHNGRQDSFFLPSSESKTSLLHQSPALLFAGEVRIFNHTKSSPLRITWFHPFFDQFLCRNTSLFRNNPWIGINKNGLPSGNFFNNTANAVKISLAVKPVTIPLIPSSSQSFLFNALR